MVATVPSGGRPSRRHRPRPAGPVAAPTRQRRSPCTATTMSTLATFTVGIAHLGDSRIGHLHDDGHPERPRGPGHSGHDHRHRHSDPGSGGQAWSSTRRLPHHRGRRKPAAFGATVWVENSHGHLVTVGEGASDHGISLAGSSLSCTGGLLATASGGVAAFSGCTFTTSGLADLVATGHLLAGRGWTPAAASVGPSPPAAPSEAQPSSRRRPSVTAGTAVPLTVPGVEDPLWQPRVTSGTGSSDAVTVTGAACSSNTVHATAGLATFAGLRPAHHRRRPHGEGQ